MYKDSIYQKMYRGSEDRKNMGYNYSDGLLSRFFSNMMYQNPRLSTFLDKIEPLFVEILDSIKKIQFYQNYTIDKNDTRYNL